MTGDVARTIAAAVHDAARAKNAHAVAAALNCVQPEALATFFHDSLSGDVGVTPLTTGLPASPGAATGRIVLTSDGAIAAGERGEHVILVRRETTPDDVLGMQAARGILTTRGGMVSHAAVVARGWGIPAVVGAGEVHIEGDTVDFGEHTLRAGDQITIDGSTGHVYPGALAISGSDAPPELETLLAWADSVAAGHMQVRANADTEGDAYSGAGSGAAASACAGPSTCSWLQNDWPRCDASSSATIPPARPPRWPSCKRSRPPTSRPCSRRWTRCRSPFGCSTHRSTSSSPTCST